MKHVREMTMGELLRRRIHDYGYPSARAASRDLGLSTNEMSRLMRDTKYPNIETRRTLARVLDLDAGVMDEVCRRA